MGTLTFKPRSVGVVGTGTMGVGIAVTISRVGHPVIVCDREQELVDTGLARIRKFLDRSVELGKLDSERRDEAVGTLRGTTLLDDLGACEVVVEAIYEDLAAKQALMASLESVCAEETLFHTNTSTLSVTSVAGRCRVPGRVVGTHYCNPAPLMRLVEVVDGLRTSPAASADTVAFLQSLGQTAICVQDTPGFIVNRFLVPFENDCLRALEAGLGTVESIDRAVKLGLNYPMGPFTLLDIVGLDIHRAVSLSLFDQLRDPRFAPPPIVDRMISAGKLGRKTGEGFYSYSERQLFGT
jgi:3-hydroxybutyryl-CoA dehydrogenase